MPKGLICRLSCTSFLLSSLRQRYTIFGDIQFLLTNFVVVADGCSIGQLPDAANVKALVRNYPAAAPCLAASSRWCFVLLGIGAPPGSFFPMVLCGGPATMRRCHLHLCHGTPAILPQRFGQQQTSFGAPGQSLRYCALASLSAPAPWPATFSRWRSATAAPLTRRSATAPQPATNLIRRRKVLRFG